MQRHNNLGLRGHIWWWRKKVRISSVSVPLAFSLETTDIKRARWLRDKLNARCAELIMAYGVMPDTMTDAQAKKVFVDSMRWQLKRILQDSPRDGQYLQEHLYANEAFGVIHQIMADNVPLTKAGEALALEAQRRGWPRDAYDFAYHEFNRLLQYPDVSGEQLDHYARAFGIKRTDTNDKRMITEIRAARSRACFEVNNMLKNGQLTRDQWVEEALSTDSPPFAFETPAVEEQCLPKADANAPASAVADVAAELQSADAVTTTRDAPVPSLDTRFDTSNQRQDSVEFTKHGDGPSPQDALAPAVPRRVTAVECMKQVISFKSLSDPSRETGGWDEKSQAQAKQSAKLFDIVTDKCMRDVGPEDLFHLVRVSNYLPSSYNLSKPADVEYIRAVSEAIRDGNEPPPLARGLASDKKVGLSKVTIRRHLTFLDAMFCYPTNDNVFSLNISVQRVRKILPVSKKANKRDANKTDYVAKLLQLPIYTGSLAHDGSPGMSTIGKRFSPGDFVCHDAWYWVFLILHYHGLRREEACKLRPDDVVDADIPYFAIDFTSEGRVKSDSSVRRVPIHPELIRLGFLAFVKACHDEGWPILFPDLKRTPGSNDYGDAYFDRVWKNIRKQAGVPNDFLIHGERHGFTSQLFEKDVDLEARAGLMGHAVGHITADTYTGRNAGWQRAYEQICRIPSVTSHLQPMPIHLNPTELHKSREKLAKLTGMIER
jgi:integrase